MRLVTGSEMKRLDSWAIGEYGIPSLLLMENAGAAVAKKAIEICTDVRGRQILILVGKGNNGGDALVCARHLHEVGADIRMFLFFAPDFFAGDAQKNWELAKKLGIRWNLIEDENSYYLLKMCLNQSILIIDGIFGTGFRGSPVKSIDRAIQAVNESPCPILSIDIPSGLNADNGKVEGSCIRAQHTVTLAWAKRGLVLFPGKRYTGELEIARISLPEQALSILESEEYYLDKEHVQGLLPVRDWEGHKNSFGHVLVIAGSAGMTGAALLASKAGLRVGAGMVTACLPCSVADYFDAVLPEAITFSVEETRNRTISQSAWPEIEQQLPQKKAVVFGPGMTAQNSTRELLAKLLENVSVPLVIDADGLNALALDPSVLKSATAPVILTPHPGEMGRLLDITTLEVQENRIEVAKLAAEEFNAIIVLKGAATIIATPGGSVFINSTGNPGLATAGTGDVLAGTIGGLLAQGMEPLDAVKVGVYCHGLAGDIVAANKGMRGMIASDILEALPQALYTLEKAD